MSTRAKMVRWSGTVAAVLAAAPLRAQQQPVAPGWFGMSVNPSEYAVAIEPVRRPGGEGFVGATVRGFVSAPYASGIVLQSVRADEYRGRRVRLTGWLRTAGDTADVQARLWMRVDGGRGPLASDCMLERPVVGTRDWARYAVVLDVPRDAVGISFGAGLTGRGQLWLDDVTFETVGRDVATTGRSASANGSDGSAAAASRVQLGELRRTSLRAYALAPTRPVNLNFEQAAVIAAR